MISDSEQKIIGLVTETWFQLRITSMFVRQVMKYFIFIWSRSIFLIFANGTRFTLQIRRIASEKSRETNNAGYRFLRGPAQGKKFRRKNAVGDEKPTGRRNLARRQPPRRPPTTVLKFPRPHPTPPFFQHHLARSRANIPGLFLFFRLLWPEAASAAPSYGLRLTTP